MSDLQYTYINDVYSDLLDVKPAKIVFDGHDVVSVVPSDVQNVGAPDLVRMDPDGNIVGVNGSLLPVYLIPVVRVLRDELRIAKQQIKSMQSDIDSLHDKIDKVLGLKPWS